MTAQPPPQQQNATPPASSPPNRTAFLNGLFAWTVLAFGLILTIAATLYLKSNVERDAEQDFSVRSREVQHKISDRLDGYTRLLQGGVSFLNASETMSREAWRTFILDQEIEKQLPGILGVGFNLLIPSAELARHIDAVRQEGFAEYRVRPVGEREVYTSIIYLEPFVARNLMAFGYDTFSEPVRRAAMEQARDTGAPAITGKVTLVQETEQDIQAGVLMYLPVYRKGLPVQTVAERRAAIHGWVSGPCRMNDLMRGIFGVHRLATDKRLYLQIFDGDQLVPGNLLYSDLPEGVSDRSGTGVRFARQAMIDFNGHHWTLAFTQFDNQLSATEYLQIWLLLVGGTLSTLLLFALIRNLQRSGLKTQQIVTLRTAELLAERQRLTGIIAESKQSEEYLRESEQRLNFLVDNSPMAVVEWDADFIVTRWAGEAEKIFGWSPEETIGKPIMALNMIFEADIPLVQDTMKQLINGHSRHVVSSNRNYTRDGRVIYCEWYNSIMLNAQGQMISVLSQVQDITERKQGEELLQQFAEDLQSKNSELERFTFTVSHDLKSPLVTIQGFIGLLEQGLGATDTEEVRSSIAYIKAASEKMYALINHLLSLSRLGKAMTLEEKVSLAEVAREALELAVGPLTGSAMTIDIASDLPWVSGDRQRLREMMQNLLENAVKYMGDQPTPHIEVGVALVDGKRACYVRDNGIGIPPQHHEKVFGIFERLDTGVEGSGIGLAKVQRIVALHGGRIWIESAGEGQGTTFWLRFPWVEPPAQVNRPDS